MHRRRPAIAIAWATAAVAAAACYALRAAITFRLGQDDLAVVPTQTTGQQALWFAAYYAIWAALTPFIFGLARRVRFRRDRWRAPLVFHLATGLVVSACAAVVLAIAYRALVLRVPVPGPADLLTPLWTHFASYRAGVDTSMYWLILAAGIVLGAYDEDQARKRQAADLERALVSAQVDALKMKLQPHFLFNTLNAISFLAVEKDTRSVVMTVERLADLLRSSMRSDGRQFATVAEELAWLDQYLAIQETRFGDRLHIVRRIDPATGQALVPSLVLQPIIENAIKHGFSQRIDARSLTITIGRDGDALVASVEDDGPGLPPGWDLATHCGRGLKNVVERLDRLYAGASALALSGAPTRGTVATLRLPWRESIPTGESSATARGG